MELIKKKYWDKKKIIRCPTCEHTFEHNLLSGTSITCIHCNSIVLYDGGKYKK